MGKRGNGEGSITQLADGRYQARLYLVKADGTRTRKAFYGATREEVAGKLNDALSNRGKGIPVAVDERQTVKTFLEGWLAAIKGNVRPKTYVGYEVYCRLHTIPEIGKVRMSKLTPQQLQALYSKKFSEGLSSTTLNHLHAMIHRALDQAVRWGVVARNVADLVDPPRPRRLEMKTLSPDQARTFLEAAAGDRLEALYILAITTGMRQGELLGLRWRDVDLDDAVLRVTGTMQRISKQGIGVSEPKTAGSRRQIALTTMAVAALKRRHKEQSEERLAAGPEWQDSDLVFGNKYGRPIESTNLIRRSFKPLLKAAGLPALRFHDLRHTAATLLLRKKVPVKIVSEMLGHSQVGITLNIYSHVLPDMQREAVGAMEAVLWG